jgi:hypothetical protein
MDIMSAVHRFDLTGLSQDQVDILMKIIPTPDEVKKYKEYGAQNNGCFDGLNSFYFKFATKKTTDF